MSSLQKILGVFLAAAGSLTLAAAISFMVVEDLSPIQAFYFAIVTVSTVGYGDIHAKTQLGMILSVVMILGGVGMFSGGVGLLSHFILSRRDREAAAAKVQLLSEIFFNSIGLGLLERFTALNPQSEKLARKLAVAPSWSDKEFGQARDSLAGSDFQIDLERADFSEWRSFIESQSQVFSILLASPAVSEGHRLTTVLRSTYHLILASRVTEQEMSTAYASGLRNDLEIVYRDITILWLDHVAHVMKAHPYVARHLSSINPFERTTP